MIDPSKPETLSNDEGWMNMRRGQSNATNNGGESITVALGSFFGVRVVSIGVHVNAAALTHISAMMSLGTGLSVFIGVRVNAAALSHISAMTSLGTVLSLYEGSMFLN